MRRAPRHGGGAHRRLLISALGESPGGRASFDEYLATWPDHEHVADVGEDAVLDAGNLVVAVKTDTRIDVQYVNFVDPDVEAVLIELARAIAEGY